MLSICCSLFDRTDGRALLSVWVIVMAQLSPARNNLACWDLACSLPSSIQLDATALWASSLGSFLVTVQIGLEEAELIEVMQYVRSCMMHDGRPYLPYITAQCPYLSLRPFNRNGAYPLQRAPSNG